MAGKLKITLKKSPLGYDYRQRRTVKALGLRKVQSTRILDDLPQIRGMIKKIEHLLDVEEIKD
ncbi:MAG: 50S ribosomal protein L30 [Kosmotoga sp.]|nr:MAG: 50S ribosomal protein L30 [Kosmotoga sp.]